MRDLNINSGCQISACFYALLVKVTTVLYDAPHIIGKNSFSFKTSKLLTIERRIFYEGPQNEGEGTEPAGTAVYACSCDPESQALLLSMAENVLSVPGKVTQSTVWLQILIFHNLMFAQIRFTGNNVNKIGGSQAKF